MATSTVENYLKHMLLLSEGGEELVSMGALAEALAVVPGTVTTMVKALADSGHVEHRPRQGQPVKIFLIIHVFLLIDNNTYM